MKSRRHKTPTLAAIDVDDQDHKYNKRRKKRRRNYHNNHSTPALLGFGIIVFSLLCVWQFYARQSEARTRQERLQRQARVERLWKERHFFYFNNNTITNNNSNNDAAGAYYYYQPQRRLEYAFEQEREHWKESGELTLIRKILQEWLDDVNLEIVHNVRYGRPRWIRPYLLPELPPSSGGGASTKKENKEPAAAHHHRRVRDPTFLRQSLFYKVSRKDDHMAWRDEWNNLTIAQQQARGPAVDYTDPHKYHYPDWLSEPPPAVRGEYPALRNLSSLMQDWHQDEDYDDNAVIQETLQHFNYSDPVQRAAAQRFRNAELPFKLYDVPEITLAGQKWTDAYVAQNFGHNSGHGRTMSSLSSSSNLLASGLCQEAPSNYFAFYIPKNWNVDTMGLPPTRNNDWTFAEWAAHARYADAVRLRSDQPHFYWQSGVPPEERLSSLRPQTFISRDLPSMSAVNATFLSFHPDQQKGIQCRFGERGVVAATHFDGGRNMVAMMTGAKRYILSPPNQCSKLGIFTSNKKSPIYRHSLLNFGHLKYLHNYSNSDDDDHMSPQERAWLERAATSRAVETVLKAGEVLYIPSHWFHYIISLQKSAQCNVRSGIDELGTSAFGGQSDVLRCKD